LQREIEPLLNLSVIFLKEIRIYSGDQSMFLLSITKSTLSRFKSYKFEEFNLPQRKLTIVTDNFLSKIFSEGDSILVIESPLISCCDPKELVLTGAKYDNKKSILEIYKPLISGRSIYYHLDSTGDFYCSTHISMLREAGIKIYENSALIPEFFVFRFIMPPQTFYKNIYQINAGSHLRINLKKDKIIIKIINDFDPPRISLLPGQFENYREEILGLLSKSIQPLKKCKNHLALLLSGGIDSSLLLRICQNLSFNIDSTYSTGYSFENFEKDYAQSAADYFGTNHNYQEIMISEYPQRIVEAISIAEQPLPNLQSILLYLLFKDGLPKKQNIVLNGVGAELSCNRTNFLIYNFRKKPLELELPKLIGKIPILSKWRTAKWSSKYYQKINYPIEEPNSVIWSEDPIGSFEWTMDYFGISQSKIIKNPLDLIKQFGERSLYDIISIYDFLGGRTATMSVWSKLGESQKKIIYYPFTDSTLVDYFFSIPENIKYESYKHVLKEVASYSGIPSFIIDRKKLGLNPLTNLALIRKIVFKPLISLASKIIDEKQIRKVQPTDWGPEFWTLWNILNYSIWKRLWINNEPKEILLEELIGS